MSNKNKKLKVTRHTESKQLSGLIFAPIFTPHKSGVSTFEPDNLDKHRIQLELNRTKNEIVKYDGYPLDVYTDFPLFSVLISHGQMAEKTDFNVKEADLFKALKRKSRTTTKDELELRLNKLKRCHVEIILNDRLGNRSRYITTSLLLEADWDREAKVVNVQMSKQLLGNNLPKTEFEMIDLRFYLSLKTEYEKALFLFLETMKHKDKPFIKVNFDTLCQRVAPHVSNKQEQRRKVKQALKKLQEFCLISSFKQIESSVQKIPQVQIVRNKHFEEIERIFH